MKKMRFSSRLLIAVASLSMIAAFFLPVWFIFLLAPQYPEGLTMQIWLTKITGQVDIINGLNHYIGMRKISEEMFPEFGYMSYILGGFIVYGLTVALTGSRKLLLSLLVVTLVVAGAAMYDFWKWGYDYGHNLDPKAAIQVPGLYYQPPLIGHKTLLNFDAYSYPDTGGWVIVGAGVVFFLVYFLEWYRQRKASKANLAFARTEALIFSFFLVLVLSSCSQQPQPFAYGKDQCDDCRMTIMEPQFGAEIVTKKGRVYKFDDVHCLAAFLKQGSVKEAEIAQTVFINYDQANQFVDSKKAWFVVSPKLESPMNSNAAAFDTKIAAEKKAAEVSGVVKNWQDLIQSL
jgi:copper chaperone NosL